MDRTRSRMAVATTVGCLSYLVAAVAVAAPPPSQPLFERATPAAHEALPMHARAEAAVSGVLEPRVLDAPAVSLALADGRVLRAELQRTASDARRGSRSWIGTFPAEPGSLLVLSQVSGVISGFASYGHETFEIQPARGGRHVFYALDPSRVPAYDRFDRSLDVHEASSGSVTTETAAGNLAEADAVSNLADAYAIATDLAGTDATSATTVHDVLIMYTPAAANSLGQANLLSQVQSAVQAAIQAYQDSQVRVTLNVVATQQSPVAESGAGMLTTLDRFRTNATVRAARDHYAADMAVLVTSESDWCGHANLQSTTINGTTNTEAYAIVATRCLSNQTLAHELGHLQGLDHDRANATGFHEYAYSYGYRKCVSDGFIDIMSYPCASTSVPRISRFSNPNLYYNGYALGVSYESDPTNSADSARTLNNTAAKVAGFRVGSTVTLPQAPSALVASSVQAGSVALGWSDNSGNEAGFRVERSADGVNFALIATVGADTRVYTDVAVAASTSYWYRVRAYNGAGTSAASNVLQVRTAASGGGSGSGSAVPAAPSAVSAVNGTNGTATVSWVDNSGNETKFVVRRSKWDASSRKWLPRTTVGTVAANVVRFVDASGKGTFRYYVKAVNAYGSSAVSGPATVTVTGP
ncbi:MAG TPA: M12 family metallo-peptidase [Steroidobacteraceae bacterium]|nr:M12 family metallo-peptidase [Steroidobacteraceae bacterium]